MARVSASEIILIASIKGKFISWRQKARKISRNDQRLCLPRSLIVNSSCSYERHGPGPSKIVGRNNV